MECCTSEEEALLVYLLCKQMCNTMQLNYTVAAALAQYPYPVPIILMHVIESQRAWLLHFNLLLNRPLALIICLYIIMCQSCPHMYACVMIGGRHILGE